jgi:hypothetical protein
MEETVEAGTKQAAVGRVDDTGGGRRGWRVAVIPVLVAVVLSVGATLLLGGAFRPGTAGSARAAPCGAVSACCPPGATAPGDR